MESTIRLEALSLVHTDNLLPGATRWLMGLQCARTHGDSMRITKTIDRVDSAAWDKVVDGKCLYFQRAYLRGVEAGAGREVEHRYAEFTRDGAPRGVACFQIARFVGPSLAPRLSGRAATKAAAWMAGIDDGPFSPSVIVCGSTFNCGDTGFAFTADVGPQEAVDLLAQAIRRIQAERQAKVRTIGTLFKEFGPASGPVTTMLEQEGYIEVPTGFEMVLDLDPAWDHWDDYLQALKSKFRVKAKRAYSKSARLEVRDLDASELRERRSRLEELYAGVVAKAAYRLGTIGMRSLPVLRASLGCEMIVRGYFLDGELVGFMTGFVLGDTLDAHAVGFDYNLNRAHSIYPRMLCDYLHIALDRGLARVNYGRTAEEIKSTLGAVPVPSRCYVKHRSPLVNPIVGLVTRSIDLSTPTLRQPFKATTDPERRAA